MTTVLENVASGDCEPAFSFPNASGVAVRVFVSAACGATGVSTGTFSLAPGAELAARREAVSEVVTILEGTAAVVVGERSLTLERYDSIHIPAGVARVFRNESREQAMTAHWAQASADPGWGTAPAVGASDLPATVVRFAEAEVYELSPGALFRDLFAARFGSVGVCGGYGIFRPGSSLPCHFHNYDESITIVEGTATCLVQGNRYQLSGRDTAFVPVGRRHRFLNESNEPMAMIWVYAGSEPERTLVDAGYCSGLLPVNGMVSDETR